MLGAGTMTNAAHSYRIRHLTFNYMEAPMNGFLSTGATFRADLNLILQLLMGFALLLGWRLARRKKFVAHMYCQSSVMVLNLILIILIMVPAFRRQVEPQILSGLRDSYYITVAIHAFLGTLAESFGLYIVLSAATRILPESLRLKNYKLWMRSQLVLWWLVIFFGLGTYYYWYIAPQKSAPVVASGPTVSDSSRVNVNIKNFSFEPKEITISTGMTVVWTDLQGMHSIAADDGSFESEILDSGGRFEHKYENSGVFPYYCPLHGDKGSKEMAGIVIVK
jgi:plastocyanin/uncharacterized membrane protein YozB (DUF420 family)